MLEQSEIDLIIARAAAASRMEDLPAESRAKLRAFLGEVALWGERIHLLGRGKLAENIRQQLLDSLLLLGAAEREAREAFGGTGPRLADIGSGAGFPGVVWKIARPAISAVLFERKLKAHAFLERTISALGLAGAEAVGDDAAFYSKPGSFDVVVSKAAGRLGDMLPLAERLLAPRGVYVTIKGASWRSELERVARAAMEPPAEIALPENRGVALIFKKAD